VVSERAEFHSETVLTVSLGPDNKGISGCEDGSVALWSTRDQALIGSWNPSGEAVNCAVFNTRDTSKLYIAADSKVYSYDQRNLGEALQTFAFHADEINEISVDEKGQYLVSCDDSGEVCCVELSRAKCVSKVTPHDNICASVQWIPSRSAEVLSGGMDCKIHHLNVYKSRPLQTMSEPMEQQGVHIVNPPFVNSIALHPACRYAAAALGSGAVNVWRLGGRKAGFVEFRNLTKHSAGAGCVKFADHNTVVSGGNDGFLHVTELETPHENGHSNGHAPDESESAKDHKDPLTMRLFHDKKVNWLDARKDSEGFIIYVCDSSPVLTKYNVR